MWRKRMWRSSAWRTRLRWRNVIGWDVPAGTAGSLGTCMWFSVINYLSEKLTLVSAVFFFICFIFDESVAT